MTQYTSKYPRGVHYTYALYYPDDYPDSSKAGIVFYLGKGAGNRINQHEYEARTGDTSYKCNVIRKIWAHGCQVEKKVLACFPTHEEALQYEIALIFFMDGLTNRTRGGEGTLDYTGEVGRKISAAKMGHSVSEEARRKISEASKSGSPEFRQKLRERHAKNPEKTMTHIRKMVEARKGKPGSHKGMPNSPETRRKLSEALRGVPRRPLSEETRRKISEANKGMQRPPITEVTLRKMSESMRGREFTPEWRQKISKANKGKGIGRKQSPETIAKRVASIKKRNAEKRNEHQLQLPDVFHD